MWGVRSIGTVFYVLHPIYIDLFQPCDCLARLFSQKGKNLVKPQESGPTNKERGHVLLNLAQFFWLFQKPYPFGGLNGLKPRTDLFPPNPMSKYFKKYCGKIYNTESKLVDVVPLVFFVLFCFASQVESRVTQSYSYDFCRFRNHQWSVSSWF